MNPESLHEKSKSTASPTTDQFVNPGTSPTPFVSMEQRKHAKVEGGNMAALKAKATTPNNV